MKKTLIVLTLLLSFIGLQANEKVVVLENLFRINNQIANTIETLSSTRQDEFYSKFYQTQTIQELNSLNSEFFGENASALNISFNDLVSNLNTFKSYNYTDQDYQAFAALHPSNNDPPYATPCKCMPCYQRCNSDWAKVGVVGSSLASWLANGAGIGGAIGGSMGSTAGGIGAGPGAVYGAELGLLAGFVIGLGEGVFKLNKLMEDCWAVHCEGKDLNPEGMGGGPGGGQKFKKFEWGGI